MKAPWFCTVALGAALSVSQIGLSAHHAFTAEFDASKAVTLTGTLTQIEWTNPHSHIHVNVTGQDGTVTAWNFELASPNMLMRRGWSRTTLRVGDKITVSGYLAKDGSHMANARSVMLSDGRTVFAGSSIENEPQK
jgi:hypothetical protein